MDWKPIDKLESVASPGLLVDIDRVHHNIEAMIRIMGREHVSRLRPHVKTHKMSAVIRLQLAAGIQKFKVATLGEAEMVAAAGGRDVLIAYQMVGPNIDSLAKLVQRHPATRFSVIADDTMIVHALGERVGTRQRPLSLFIDIDGGMHRTGIPLGQQVDQLRSEIESKPALSYAGLHLYDGHAHSPDFTLRQAEARRLIAAVLEYDRVNPSPAIVGGGSPTFAIWSAETDWECSPGTPIFWDRGYDRKFAETPFQIAVAMLVRIISKPGANRVCFDLGYKAVASEVGLTERLSIPAIEDLVLTAHSEEHLVGETETANQLETGQAFLAFPRHICPTVAMYDFATVVRDGVATDERWQITPRSRGR